MEQIDRRTESSLSVFPSLGLKGYLCHPTLRDREGRAPLVTQNVEAYAAVGIDVGMVDSGSEVDFGRFKGVIGGEMYGQEEDSSGVWTVSLYQLSKTHDREGVVHSRVPLWLLASETVPRACISIPKAVQENPLVARALEKAQRGSYQVVTYGPC